jgi:hypothetical protein
LWIGVLRGNDKVMYGDSKFAGGYTECKDVSRS